MAATTAPAAPAAGGGPASGAGSPTPLPLHVEVASPTTEGALLGIMYSEFDNVTGPKPVFRVPERCLSTEAFDSISDYVITKPQLCGSIVCVTVGDVKVMGYPLLIENEKYHRNALMFNIAFLLRDSADPAPYEPALRKLGSTLHTLEVESEFLFQESTKVCTVGAARCECITSRLPQSKLPDILVSVLAGLQLAGGCVVPINASSMVCLTLVALPAAPPVVKESDVPLFTVDVSRLHTSSWDLSMQMILPHIDGTNFVQRIALLAAMDVSYVIHAIQQLVYYRLVVLVDVFQYSNIYACTPKLPQLFVGEELSRASKFVINRPAGATSSRGPPYALLFGVFAAFGSGTTVSDVAIRRRTQLLHIDDRRLVAYGVVHGYLRRVHEYPLPVTSFIRYHSRHGGNATATDGGDTANGAATATTDGQQTGLETGGRSALPSSARPASGTATTGVTPYVHHGLSMQEALTRMLALCDGRHTLDDMCVQLMRSRAEILKELEGNSHFVIIRK